LSVKERERIAELLAEGAPFWRLCEEVHRVGAENSSGTVTWRFARRHPIFAMPSVLP
jgi:hypothetical protein